MATTIRTTFETRSLPTWARRYPAVVALAERDLAYRADIHRAKTAQYRRFLRREAERRISQRGAAH